MNKAKSIAFYIDIMQKGGANRVVANLVNYFASQDYDVFLINDVRLENKDDEYQVDEKVHRIILNEQRKNKFLSNIGRIRQIHQIIRREKINVAVSFMGPPNIRLLFASIGLRCKKFVSVRNDPNVEYGSSALIKLLTGWLFGLADGCIFQTEDAKGYFPKNVQTKSKVILNPVNPLFYNVKRSEHPKDIVTVGRLFEQKNQLLLIKAFESICKDFPDENLYIYGEGPLRETLTKYIAGHDLTERVFLSGQISDVADVLSKAKLFVLSSDYEGLPNALMEAMAVSVPVISTDCPCGGPRALIESNRDGLLVPCSDVDALAGAMSSILGDSEKRNEFGIQAGKRALSFRPEVILNVWENLFYSI